MAKVIVKLNIKRTIKKAMKNKTLFEKIGRFSVKRIKETTRDGFSMEGGVRHKLPELTEGTVKRREILAILNPAKIDKTNFEPDKSNISFTGSLLNSVKFILSKPGVFGLGFKVKIDVDDKKSRKKLKGLRGKTLETSTNKAVYDDLKNRGFGFLGMDKEGQAKIKKMIEIEIRKALRRLRRK